MDLQLPLCWMSWAGQRRWRRCLERTERTTPPFSGRCLVAPQALLATTQVRKTNKQRFIHMDSVCEFIHFVHTSLCKFSPMHNFHCSTCTDFYMVCHSRCHSIFYCISVVLLSVEIVFSARLFFYSWDSRHHWLCSFMGKSLCLIFRNFQWPQIYSSLFPFYFFFYLLACMIGGHTLPLVCFHGAPHWQHTDRKQLIIVKASEFTALCFASQMNILSYFPAVYLFMNNFCGNKMWYFLNGVRNEGFYLTVHCHYGRCVIVFFFYCFF